MTLNHCSRTTIVSIYHFYREINAKMVDWAHGSWTKIYKRNKYRQSHVTFIHSKQLNPAQKSLFLSFNMRSTPSEKDHCVLSIEMLSKTAQRNTNFYNTPPCQ